MERVYMKHRGKTFIAIIVTGIILCTGILNYSYAAVSKSDDWTNTDYAMGRWVPYKGKMTVSFYQNDSGTYRAKTTVTMTLTSKNVARIKLHNSAATSTIHEDCRGIKTYLTCDVTSKHSGGSSVMTDNMHATSVTSDLPNPKYDLENDNANWDSYKEESETVALGTVSNQEYEMITYWNDKRGKTGTYGGKFLCQYSMSKKGASDYNTVIIADGVQASVSYGKARGSF